MNCFVVGHGGSKMLRLWIWLPQELNWCDDFLFKPTFKFWGYRGNFHWGKLRHGGSTCMLSKAACVAQRGDVLLDTPWSYLMWQLLCVVRELACKKYNLWLELSASNTDINWDSRTANKKGEIQSEEVLDGFDSLCPFRHEKDFLVCQDQHWAELCTTGHAVVH